MKKHLPATVGLTALALLALTAGVALAQGGFGIPWHTVESGGGGSAGGPYTVQGTAGQAEAGALLSGGSYTLAGGFWGAAGAGPERQPLFIPLTLR